MMGAPPQLLAVATSWTLLVERPAGPAERDAHGTPLAFVGRRLSHLPRYWGDLAPADLLGFFEPLQRRICQQLDCSPSDLTWYGYPEWPQREAGA